MKIELQDLGPVKKALVIEADPTEVERETEAAVRRYASQVHIPGFRAGKVPLEIVRNRFRQEIRDDVRDRLVARLYTEASRERGLRPLGDPALDEVSQEEGGPFRFKTTFEVAPEISPQGYKGIEAQEPAATVTVEDVERLIEEIRQAQAKFVVEEGRQAVSGDILVADVEGEPEAGEPFRRERITLDVGAADTLPQFNEHILGASAGSVLEFPVTYPKEHGAERLSGTTVRYRITVHEVKRREVPPLDDEFARDLGEFENLAGLRDRVRADLEQRKRHEARQQVRRQVLDRVLLENPVPLPEVLVDEEIRHRLEDLVRGMMMQGIDPAKAELDWKRLRDGQEEPARKAVHARLLLDAVAAAESIQVEPADLEALVRREAERRSERFEVFRAKIEKEGGLEALRNQLVREKTLDFLASVANIQKEG